MGVQRRSLSGKDSLDREGVPCVWAAGELQAGQAGVSKALGRRRLSGGGGGDGEEGNYAGRLSPQHVPTNERPRAPDTTQQSRRQLFGSSGRGQLFAGPLQPNTPALQRARLVGVQGPLSPHRPWGRPRQGLAGLPLGCSSKESRLGKGRAVGGLGLRSTRPVREPAQSFPPGLGRPSGHLAGK